MHFLGIRYYIGLQWRVGIYVSYESLLIIKYLEPLTDDLFTVLFADCIFYETHFSALGGRILEA